MRVGVDTGGTFTDFIYQTASGLSIFKLASTPADPSQAIINGLERIAHETGTSLEKIEIVHGTTVGTNALLERRGARTALITTAGFEDVLVIGRQARPSLYDLNVQRPASLVPDELRLGIHERVNADGAVIEPLDLEALESLVDHLKSAKVDSVAVVLIFSFLHPNHEQRIAEALARLNVPLSISHQLLPEYREYERTSTVTINAYLQPLMSQYLHRLSKHVPALRVMQSAGGSISASVAGAEPVRTILSGPAGGVVGALRAAHGIGVPNIITFDMGGTSTDVALCTDGEMRMTNEATVAGLPVAVAMMDIHTVGAGGGSIARVDAGGGLRVGPQSAGADPGPACYGRGLLPTVTDANLVLGRFGGAQLLGGDFTLDEERAREALMKLAREMSEAAGRRINLVEAALGVVRVVNAGMERALRLVSVERGFDPRGFALLTFGGAGGLHAVELARALRVPRVIVPQRPGALSALGALASDVVRERSRTVMLGATAENQTKLADHFREMNREARSELRREGFSDKRQRHDASVNARYKGQSFELELKIDVKQQGTRAGAAAKLASLFHQTHKARYGYALDGNTIELVSARLRSIGIIEPLQENEVSHQPKRRTISKNNVRLAPHATAPVHFTPEAARRPSRVAVYRREDLPPGARLRVPSIITEYSSTTLVPPGSAHAFLDQLGNLIIEL
ncbi:MAG: hydantoinase/oxoprolinase family protein [Pyrinomonadaceae bacterium]|nr:hydantoinase/oxoprolinase family protein [Pyrinomonadaceae bacterium]